MTRALMLFEALAFSLITALILLPTPLWLFAALLYRKPLLGVAVAVVIVALTACLPAAHTADRCAVDAYLCSDGASADAPAADAPAASAPAESAPSAPSGETCE